MTLDEGVTKVMGQIDAHMTRTFDRNLIFMIECGVDDALARDMLADQRAVYAARRLQLLDEVREMLLAAHLDPW